MIAEAQKQEAQRSADIGAVIGREKERGEGATGQRIRGPFSHNASNVAYHHARQETLGKLGLKEPATEKEYELQSRRHSGYEQAHQDGMQAGHMEYANAVRRLGGKTDLTPPMRTAEHITPGPTSPTISGQAPPGGTAPTMPAPTPGPTAPTLVGQAPPGGPAPPITPPATPATPDKPDAPGDKQPGTRGGTGAGGQPQWLQALTRPLTYGTGSSIGGGMFSPGGTISPTAGTLAGTMHGLLNYRDQAGRGSPPQGQQKPKQDKPKQAQQAQQTS
jgi:hypothetical protein